MVHDDLYIVVICNNYDMPEYGIGKYSGIIVNHFPEWVKPKVFDGYCDDYAPHITKIFNFNMVKATINATYYVKNNNVNAVLIEYPYADWNPLIMPITWVLARKIKEKNGKIFISLHEYDRVSSLRKRVIEFLCKISDGIFVYSHEMGKKLQRFSKQYYVRSIMSNITFEESEVSEVKRESSNYVFFGMVTSMKAFDEMLIGWDEFNKDGKRKLYIITGTKLSNSIIQHNNVEYIFNASDYKIIETMRKCAFSILPIKPYIDGKNATFKTSSQCGCISIGKFFDRYKKYPFIISMDDYNSKSFVQALYKSTRISKETLLHMSQSALLFANKFSPAVVATGIAEDISRSLEDKNN